VIRVVAGVPRNTPSGASISEAALTGDRRRDGRPNFPIPGNHSCHILPRAAGFVPGPATNTSVWGSDCSQYLQPQARNTRSGDLEATDRQPAISTMGWRTRNRLSLTPGPPIHAGLQTRQAPFGRARGVGRGCHTTAGQNSPQAVCPWESTRGTARTGRSDSHICGESPWNAQ
jgi:hypothetical protein